MRLAPLVRLEAFAAQEIAAMSRRDNPPVAPHHLHEAGEVLVRQLAAYARGASAVPAVQQRLALHGYFSPAAGKTGVISTGMSSSVALTDCISGVSLP